MLELHQEKRLAIFGDSHVSDEYYTGFPLWVDKLRHIYGGIGPLFNLGIYGDTSTFVLERMPVECEAREPHVIIVKIGGNDARLHRTKVDTFTTPLETFKDNVAKMIAVAKERSAQILFIGEPPVNEELTTPVKWDKTEFFYNKNMKLYNQAMREVCEKHNVPFLDPYPIWEQSDYKKLLLDDGLHFNEEGSKQMFHDVKMFLIKNTILKG